MSLTDEIARRRTFAIISHPDAGKTTLTEQLLLFGGAIQLAGTVKARKAARHATSDWMAMEKERGISITSSVMQFPYQDHIVNLLDTPGHADFSEDTYRTLTAVDSALMVIDCAKGVEARTIKLMEVCRLRTTPIYTFINKLDREGRDPIELLDEIEDILDIRCAPVTWPIGMGKRLKGVYHLLDDEVILYDSAGDGRRREFVHCPLEEARPVLGDALTDEVAAEVELVRGASHKFDLDAYRRGELTPVFFGAAINNFGVTQLLDSFVKHAPPPQARSTTGRDVAPTEEAFSGFVFKVQANMDPAHRDRVAFVRVCSGQFDKKRKLHHVRSEKEMRFSNPLTFMAESRESADTAFPGDIVGLHSHGTIAIGDSFSEGEELYFTGIPSFAPELFRRAQLKDPLRAKQLRKGLEQLAEEGATQFFAPLLGNDLIVGAVGMLQFEVVAYRLQDEYNVDCAFENVNIATARWVRGPEDKQAALRRKTPENLATDHLGDLVYLAPTRVNLDLTGERHPDLTFSATRDFAAA